MRFMINGILGGLLGISLSESNGLAAAGWFVSICLFIYIGYLKDECSHE